MAFQPESKYPNSRSCVPDVGSDAKPDALVGRLENLVTGKQREFATGGELLESIARDLASSDAKPQVGGDA